MKNLVTFLIDIFRELVFAGRRSENAKSLNKKISVKKLIIRIYLGANLNRKIHIRILKCIYFSNYRFS